MKASILALALASGALAQLSGVPTCATQCILQVITGSGCSATDISCICGDDTTSCSLLQCAQQCTDQADIDQATQAIKTLCQTTASFDPCHTNPGNPTYPPKYPGKKPCPDKGKKKKQKHGKGGKGY